MTPLRPHFSPAICLDERNRLPDFRHVRILTRRDLPSDDARRSGTLTAGKRRRNGVYLACGIAIIVALVSIAAFSITDAYDIFWPEAVAIWAFAISWLVKGRADYTIKAAVRKLTGR